MGPRAPVQETFSQRPPKGRPGSPEMTCSLTPGPPQGSNPPRAPGGPPTPTSNSWGCGERGSQSSKPGAGITAMLGSKNPKVLHGRGWRSQWKAESPIATRPCKAHPGLNQGAGSWYPPEVLPPPLAPLNLLLTVMLQRFFLSPLSKGLCIYLLSCCFSLTYISLPDFGSGPPS